MRSRTRGNKNQPVTRRDFCGAIAASSAGLMFWSSAAAQQDPSLVYPARKIEDAERLLPGSSLFFTYPTRSDPAILIRAADGEYFAYSQRCTHRGCSVYFDPNRRSLECPCHRGAFDLKSGVALYGPPQRPLEQIDLQIRAGGQIWAVGKRDLQQGIQRVGDTFA